MSPTPCRSHHMSTSGRQKPLSARRINSRSGQVVRRTGTNRRNTAVVRNATSRPTQQSTYVYHRNHRPSNAPKLVLPQI